ncbi:MAG: hypothetical protein KDB82_04875 [Planctomycetes bacterium]|nr:hypothetical protein [Planctomycetota bacterium]
MAGVRKILYVLEKSYPEVVARDRETWEACGVAEKTVPAQKLPRRVPFSAQLVACFGMKLGWAAVGLLAVLVPFNAVVSFTLRSESRAALAVLGVLSFFLLAAVATTAFDIRAGFKSLRLLRNGFLAWAYITDAEARETDDLTGPRGSKMKRWYVHCVFRTDADEVLGKLMRFDDRSPVDAESMHLLLYDGDYPLDCMLVPSLRYGLDVEPDGKVAAQANCVRGAVLQLTLLAVLFGANIAFGMALVAHLH